MIPFNHSSYPFPSQRDSLYARRGMIATSHPMASEAGMSILRKGGNAIDAAVAAAIALGVVEPGATGAGGDLFAIVHTNGALYGLNASGYSPAAMTHNAIQSLGHETIPGKGWLPVTVSGGPAGWAALCKRFGRLPMEDVFQPAVELAQSHAATPGYASGVNRAAEGFRDTGDAVYKPFLAHFQPGGIALNPGQEICRPELAETLRELAQTQCESFYRGTLAKTIDAWARESGGLVRYDDYADYEPQWVEPVSINYRGYDIWELPPNGQGITPLMALNIMEGFDPVSFGDAQSLHWALESMKLAFADAFEHITDPDCLTIDFHDLLTKDYAAKRRSLIGRNAICPPPGTPHHGGTVYLCCVDGEGNMISLIQSIADNFGSGVVIPGTGILMQNRGAAFKMDLSHANAIAPHKRSFHTIIPGFITKGGAPVGPMGLMGGHMQPQGHMQVVMNMIDYGMNPQAALDAPRWLWQREKRVRFEPAWDKAVIDALRARGHDIEISTEGYYGRGQIIVRLEDGSYCGGTEPRGGGCIIGY